MASKPQMTAISLPQAANAPRAIDERALVTRAQGGDVAAFERLYLEHSGRVFALCLRLSADRNTARELTQDVFVRAWDALPEFRGEAGLATWLHRIAVNAMLMRERTERRRGVHGNAEDELEVEVAAPPVDVGSAIDLERAIAALPPGVRRAFVLHEVEGYTHQEIADMTGLAAGTLRAQLHRARQLLTRTLGS